MWWSIKKNNGNFEDLLGIFKLVKFMTHPLYLNTESVWSRKRIHNFFSRKFFSNGFQKCFLELPISCWGNPRNTILDVKWHPDWYGPLYSSIFLNGRDFQAIPVIIIALFAGLGGITEISCANIPNVPQMANFAECTSALIFADQDFSWDEPIYTEN